MMTESSNTMACQNPAGFDRDIDDKTLFFTHSTGKSIISYIVGHAICEGYISSVNEPINWPLMKNTLYDGQPLINLLNMNAGDKHTVNPRSSRVMAQTSTIVTWTIFL